MTWTLQLTRQDLALRWTRRSPRGRTCWRSGSGNARRTHMTMN